MWAAKAPDWKRDNLCAKPNATDPMLVEFGIGTVLHVSTCMDQNDHRDRKEIRLRINEWLKHNRATVVIRKYS